MMILQFCFGGQITMNRECDPSLKIAMWCVFRTFRGDRVAVTYLMKIDGRISRCHRNWVSKKSQWFVVFVSRSHVRMYSLLPFL